MASPLAWPACSSIQPDAAASSVNRIGRRFATRCNHQSRCAATIEHMRCAGSRGWKLPLRHGHPPHDAARVKPITFQRCSAARCASCHRMPLDRLPAAASAPGRSTAGPWHGGAGHAPGPGRRAVGMVREITTRLLRHRRRLGKIRPGPPADRRQGLLPCLSAARVEHLPAQARLSSSGFGGDSDYQPPFGSRQGVRRSEMYCMASS